MPAPAGGTTPEPQLRAGGASCVRQRPERLRQAQPSSVEVRQFGTDAKGQATRWKFDLATSTINLDGILTASPRRSSNGPGASLPVTPKNDAAGNPIFARRRCRQRRQPARLDPETAFPVCSKKPLVNAWGCDLSTDPRRWAIAGLVPKRVIATAL